MTIESELIQVLNDFEFDEKNVPVELVMALERVRKNLLAIPKPRFTENQESIMNEEVWAEFTYTGLNNIDFITTNFYKNGYEPD